MRIDALPPTATDRDFLSAWIADLKQAIPTMTHPREQIVRRRMERQLAILECALEQDW